MIASQLLNSLCHGASVARSALFDSRPPAAYVGGWLGKQNLGDEALFVAYQSLFPKINFLHFDGGRAARQIFSRVRSLSAGMLGGGTLIGEHPKWLEIPQTFSAIHSKFFVFGTGVEEPTFWKGARTLDNWKPLLDRCEFCGVRGPRSAELLGDIGLDGVEVVGDPILTFAAKDINRTPTPNSIGLNIGTAGTLWGDTARVRDEMIVLAKTAKEAGWRVEWFVVWPSDLEITRQAAQASGTAQHIHVICKDHELFIKKVRQLSAFVGMKLHSTALATCALTPSIMLEYRPKCLDYMRSINQEKFTFRTDTFSAGAIWEIVREWNQNREAAASSLAQGVQSCQAKQSTFAAKVARMLSPQTSGRSAPPLTFPAFPKPLGI
jgi:polysaccharide pyruvyl transferase WcaK-like protein